MKLNKKEHYGKPVIAPVNGSVNSMVEMLGRFVTDDKTRYYMTGIYLEPGEGDAVNCVATDGKRLAITVIGKSYLPKNLELPGIYIITSDKYYNTFYPVEGTFPNYRRVMPDTENMELWGTRLNIEYRKKNTQLTDISHELVHFLLWARQPFNLQYFLDFYPGKYTVYAPHDRGNDHCKAFVFDSNIEELKIILMPMIFSR